MVVSAAWLTTHLDDADLVLLQVGTKDDYAAGHIRGTAYLPVADVSAPPGDGLTMELPPVDRLKTALEAVGVGDGARIIICYPGNQIVQATRLFFALDAFGFGDRTAILDGGLGAWQAEQQPTTVEVRPPIKRTLTPRLRPVVVDYQWVSEHGREPGVAVLDARPPEQFSGEQPAGRPPRTGHIPGAINIPVSQLVSNTFHWKAPRELADVFERASVKPGDRVVTYCNVGQQASALYFAARYLGYDVVLYDGSLEDWGARGGPVVRDPPPPRA
jgi:thiosulfate/3-mercaptopyruvate sulfurtransferase